MTYGLTDDGFIIKPFEAILSEIEEYIIENIDTGITRDRLSVIGHLNTNAAQQLSELWEGLQAVCAAQSREGASGISLQYIGALTGTYLSGYSKTTVTATVTLNPNTSLPIGSVANLSGQPNVRFLTTEAVTASIAGGDYDVTFEAEYDGAISVAAGQLDEISEAVSGWIAVSNDNPGVTGTEPETDPNFRIKIERELGASGSTNLTAIIASVVRDTDCTNANGKENDTDLTDSFLLPPHSIHIVCKDGTSADIAQTIFEEKAAGIRTFGSEEETVLDHNDEDQTIYFSYAETVDHSPQFAFYFDTDNYTWEEIQVITLEALGDFYNEFKVGQSFVADDLKCMIKELPGFLSFYIWNVSDVNIDYDQLIVFDEWNSSS